MSLPARRRRFGPAVRRSFPLHWSSVRPHRCSARSKEAIVRYLYFLATVLVPCLCVGFASAAGPARVDFQKDVLPLFKTYCYRCHDGRKHKSEFRIDVRSKALRGGDSGKPGIVAGHSDRSEIIRRVTVTNDDRMPPKGKRLSAGEIQTLQHWIDSGASWPAALANETGAHKKHWAFIAPVRPPLPAVKDQTWV